VSDPPTAADRVRVAILGSCVSRDTVGYAPDRFDLITYVARQSWISAGLPAAGVADALVPLDSAFQQRMVDGDVRGDALDRLAAVADRVDVLLLDLVDERGGVIEVGGGYVTKLVELWSAGGARATRGGRHVPFGTDEHFAAWCEGADRVLGRLDATALLGRAILLRTPWADRHPDGTPLKVPEWMIPPAEANELYRRYHRHLADAGVAVVDLPARLATTPRDHRWGPSPFHYGDAAYASLAADIVERSTRVG
jgi:hypothetical protein